MVGDNMKKLLFSLFCLLISLNIVSADTFKLTLEGEDSFDSNLSLKIKINSLTGFTTGLYGIETIINYDKNKISLESITGLNNFDVTYDISISDKIVAYSHIGIPVNTEILTLNFKNNSLANNENTTISFNNTIASDGENDINGSISSKTVTYMAPDFEKGDMNKDGNIGLSDVIKLLRLYLGVETTTDEYLTLGDMNNDGIIGLSDVITLLKKYLGVI